MSTQNLSWRTLAERSIDEKELMRRWMEFYKGTLQNIASLGHPASLIAQQALDVKVLPGFQTDRRPEHE